MINKKLLLSVLSVGTLVLGAVAPVTVLAAESRVENSTATATFTEDNTNPVDPVDPGNPTDPTDPEISNRETGPLTIDYVSNFDFGTHPPNFRYNLYSKDHKSRWDRICELCKSVIVAPNP